MCEMKHAFYKDNTYDIWKIKIMGNLINENCKMLEQNYNMLEILSSESETSKKNPELWTKAMHKWKSIQRKQKRLLDNEMEQQSMLNKRGMLQKKTRIDWMKLEYKGWQCVNDKVKATQMKDKKWDGHKMKVKRQEWDNTNMEKQRKQQCIEQNKTKRLQEAYADGSETVRNLTTWNETNYGQSNVWDHSDVIVYLLSERVNQRTRKY